MSRCFTWSAGAEKIRLTILVSTFVPCFALQAQIPQPRDYSYFPGCYDLSAQEANGKYLVNVRVAFDTVPKSSPAVSPYRLRFPNATFGATSLGRAEWALGKGDSVFVTIGSLDSEISFSFGRFGADTVRGRAESFMFGGGITRQAAIAVKQKDC